MTVYPTQATSTIHYIVSNEAAAAVTVQVYTTTGQPVISQKEVLQVGLNVRSLNVSNLAKGSYILKVQVSGNNLVK